MIRRMSESRPAYQTQTPPREPNVRAHPLRALLDERAEPILRAGGKWRVLLHIAGGVVRKAEITELDIEVETT